MSKNLEFKVKIKSFSWKNYYLIIRENDFQLKKEKTKYYYTYSLSKAAVFDVSDKEMQKIMVSSSKYKIFIRPSYKEDKNVININYPEEEMKEKKNNSSTNIPKLNIISMLNIASA